MVKGISESKFILSDLKDDREEPILGLASELKRKINQVHPTHDKLNSYRRQVI